MTRVPGPVPGGVDPEAYDQRRRRVLWSLPTGLYVIGSRGPLEGATALNLMTANLVTQVALEPKLVAVALDAGSRTLALVASGGVFSVNLLHRADRALVRRFVKPVTDIERDAGGRPTAMAGVPVRTAATGAPLLAQALAWLDCEVRHRLDLGSHVLVVGEVVDVGEAAAPEEAPGGPAGDRPEVLRMEDTRMNYGG